MNRNRWLKLRITAEEKATFEFSAAEAGMNLSDFIRQRLMAGRLRRTAEECEAVRRLTRWWPIPIKATPRLWRSSST